jgi:hypothetical protein
MIALGRASHPILPLFFMGYKMCKSNVSIAQKGGDTLYKKKRGWETSWGIDGIHNISSGGRETITRENKKLEGGSRKNGKLLIERVNWIRATTGQCVCVCVCMDCQRVRACVIKLLSSARRTVLAWAGITGGGKKEKKKDWKKGKDCACVRLSCYRQNRH